MSVIGRTAWILVGDTMREVEVEGPVVTKDSHLKAFGDPITLAVRCKIQRKTYWRKEVDVYLTEVGVLKAVLEKKKATLRDLMEEVAEREIEIRRLEERIG